MSAPTSDPAMADVNKCIMPDGKIVTWVEAHPRPDRITLPPNYVPYWAREESE